MPVLEEVVQSPCNRVCTLDDADVCLGCGRTLDEIKAWGGADRQARLTILNAAERRQAERGSAHRWLNRLRPPGWPIG